MPIVNYLKALIPFAAVIILGVTSAAPAGAVIIAGISDEILFTGVCSDCSGDAYAILTLSGLNNAGSSLTGSNFVSFFYAGTNLVSQFTIDNGDPGFSVSGNLPSVLPGPANLTIAGDGYTFQSFSNGNWTVSVPRVVVADMGGSSGYSSAPEPATMGMLGLGIVAIAFTQRRRIKARS